MTDERDVQGITLSNESSKGGIARNKRGVVERSVGNHGQEWRVYMRRETKVISEI